MYQIKEKKRPALDFELPFAGDLDPDNRWAVLSEKIPWDAFEQEQNGWVDVERESGTITFRMALGALIIQKKFVLTDRETVALIKESPYLQYFVGMKSYDRKDAFDPSLMTYFRKRISSSLIIQINDDVKHRQTIKGKTGINEVDKMLIREIKKQPYTFY